MTVGSFSCFFSRLTSQETGTDSAFFTVPMSSQREIRHNSASVFGFLPVFMIPRLFSRSSASFISSAFPIESANSLSSDTLQELLRMDSDTPGAILSSSTSRIKAVRSFKKAEGSLPLLQSLLKSSIAFCVLPSLMHLSADTISLFPANPNTS